MFVSLFGTWRFSGIAEPWVLGRIPKRWVHSMLIPRKSNPQKTTPRLHYRFQAQKKWGPQARCTPNMCKDFSKKCAKILARMAPKMADRMFSNLSTFQSYLFLRKWVKNRSHLPSSWSALISRAVLPAAPFYSPGSPNIFITFLVSSSPSWSLIPMFFFPL